MGYPLPFRRHKPEVVRLQRVAAPAGTLRVAVRMLPTLRERNDVIQLRRIRRAGPALLRWSWNPAQPALPAVAVEHLQRVHPLNRGSALHHFARQTVHSFLNPPTMRCACCADPQAGVAVHWREQSCACPASDSECNLAVLLTPALHSFRPSVGHIHGPGIHHRRHSE